MTTLISRYNSEGCVGRCDAKCHEAKSPLCDCICGGANHGVGHERAVENVRNYTHAQLKAIEEKGGFISDELRQAVLL